MEQDAARMIDVLGLLGRRDFLFVDLRTPEEYAQGHLKGAVNIPYDSLQKKKPLLAGWRRIYVYCDRGNLSLLACRDLKQEGYPVVNLWGGVHSFEKELGSRDKKFVDCVWEKN